MKIICSHTGDLLIMTSFVLELSLAVKIGKRKLFCEVGT